MFGSNFHTIKGISTKAECHDLIHLDLLGYKPLIQTIIYGIQKSVGTIRDIYLIRQLTTSPAAKEHCDQTVVFSQDAYRWLLDLLWDYKMQVSTWAGMFYTPAINHCEVWVPSQAI